MKINLENYSSKNFGQIKIVTTTTTTTTEKGKHIKMGDKQVENY